MEEKKKILWIDDDVNNPELECYRDALEEKGCDITPVTNPDKIPFDNIKQFDCIIIDLFLPVGERFSLADTEYGSITGFLSLKEIITNYPKNKVVVFSMFKRSEVISFCKEYNIQYWYKFEHNDGADDNLDWSEEFAKDIIKVING